MSIKAVRGTDEAFRFKLNKSTKCQSLHHHHSTCLCLLYPCNTHANSTNFCHFDTVTFRRSVTSLP